MNNKVNFLRGTSAEYEAATKDNDIFYYTTDNGKLYLGDKEIPGAGVTEEQLVSALAEHNISTDAHAALFQGGKTVEKSAAYTLDNAVDYPLIDLRLYGKSTQDGVPTPDAPVDIVSIGDSGTVGVTACGENLLNPKQIIHAIYNDNGELVTEGQYIPNYDMYDFIKISGKTVTITATKCSDIGEGIRYAVFDKNKKFINREIFVDAEEVTVNRPDADYIRVFMSNVDYKTPHACYGENGTSEPYVGSTASLTSALPLCGIPVDADGNYTDSNGQQWICDELIYNTDGTGMVIKRTNKMTFDGSDDEALQLGSTIVNSKHRLYIELEQNIKPLYKSSFTDRTHSLVLCNKYEVASPYETYNNKTSISINHHTTLCGFSIYNEAHSSDTLNEWKSYLASNPITVVYPLNTPQEIQLTAEEMTALKALQTFDGVTNVSNDKGAEMCFTYCISNALSDYVLPVINGSRKEAIEETLTAAKTYADNLADWGETVDKSSFYTLNNAVDYPIVDMHLYGRSTQNQYSGKNLLNYNAWKDVKITGGTAVFENNGVTLTATTDDCFTNYKADSTDNSYKFPEAARIPIKEGETITLSWQETDNKAGYMYIFPNGDADGSVSVNNKVSKSLSYTATAGISFVTFRFGVRNSGDTISYKNIQIEKDSTATEYEPYVGGVPSPNPDYPQDILSVENPTVTACGKNMYEGSQDWSGEWENNDLWENDIETYLGLSVKKAKHKWSGLRKKIYVEKGKTYTFSCYAKADTDVKISIFIVTNNASSFARPTKMQNLSIGTEWARYQLSYTCEKSGYIRPRIEKTVSDDNYVYVCGYQLEIGDTATDYESYIGSTAILPYTLHGVPVEADGNYTDSNGQQWICDELIYNADGTGKIVKRVDTFTFDGSDDEQWATSGTSASDKWRLATSVKKDVIRPAKTSSEVVPIICNSYLSNSANGTFLNIDSIAVNTSGTIYIYNETCATYTLDEWKSYLASNPVTVVSVLNTPQEILLTAEGMTALKALQTFDGVTNISNDKGAEMQIKYCTNSELSEYALPIIKELENILDEHTHTVSDIIDFPESLPANGGNAATVNGYTVNANVPAGFSPIGQNTKNKTYTYEGSTYTGSNTSEVFNDYTNNMAAGTYSHAEGYQTKALESYAHSEGVNTAAIGWGSHAEGSNLERWDGPPVIFENPRQVQIDDTITITVTGSQASGLNSHAEGCSTLAYGKNSHTEGYHTAAKANGSHAEGYESEASGSYSHAEGYMTTAGYNASHAEGHHTTASGGYSHAEGYETIASSYASHAEGHQTTASGGYSHAEGYKTTASNYASHVSGKYNVAMTTGGDYYNTTGTAFVIGNGTSTSTLSNAFSVQYDGIVKAKSTITASTTADYAEFFEWLDGNPDDEDRVGYFVTLDGDKIRIATAADDYILGVVSGEPFVLGNGDCDTWNGMYLHDEFRRTIYEPAPKMVEILDSEGNPTGEYEEVEGEFEGTRPKLNPEYDYTQPYISRFERKEWAPVGMLGVLAVRHDGTAQVNGYVTVNANGIATACEKSAENAYRVIKSNTDSVVEIIFR